MGEVKYNHSYLNSSYEIGMRVSIVLETFYPKFLDINQLVCLDYIMTHLGEFVEAEKNILPRNPLFSSELIVKYKKIQIALEFYQQRGIIVKKVSPSGFTYRAGRCYPDFVHRIDSEYIDELKKISEKTKLVFESNNLFDMKKLFDITAQAK